MPREIDGVACNTAEDFVAAAAKAPPGATMALCCVQCQARLFFVDWLPARKVLAFKCCNCGAPGLSPVILEGRETEAPAEPGRIIQ